MEIQQWPPSRLKPYARNPRKNDAAVDRMCASIREFGFRIPILAKSDGGVVDGHLRLKAGIKLEMETLPVIVVDDMTEPQIKAFRLIANRSVAWAEWDDEMLSVELQELQSADYDLALTGFDGDEIERLLAAGDAPDAFDDELEAATGKDTVRATIEIPSRAWLTDAAELRRRVEKALHGTGAVVSWPD